MHSQPTGAAAPPERSRIAVATPIAVALLIALLLAWSAWPTLRPTRTVEVTQAVFLRTAQPEDPQANTPRRSGATVQAPGWLEAEPFYTACTALADGVIESIEVLEGDRVDEGQVIARLVADDAELALARAEAELARARAASAAAGADLAAAQTAWEEPVELQRAVASGSAELAERRAELAQLPSLIAAARATLVGYQEELKRAETSLKSQATNELEVIIARQLVESQSATVESLEARSPILEARARRLESEVTAAERNLTLRIEDRRRLDAARAGAALAEASVQQAEAVRDEAQLRLHRMNIRAPIAGYVQRRLKVPGDKVIQMMDSPHSAHVLHIYDPAKLQVRVDIPLAEAANVYVGQPCEVVVEVLPDQTFAGEVLIVTHEADLQKNTLQAKVRVIDPSPLLRPEMLTRVKFLAGDASTMGNAPTNTKATALVPEQSITPDGAVWTVRERNGSRGLAERAPVSVISIDQGWASVSGPLNPGDLLITRPAGLTEGQPVRITTEGGAS